jgi:actin-related protein
MKFQFIDFFKFNWSKFCQRKKLNWNLTMEGETYAITMDIGSGVSKAGFSGFDSPIACFPSIIGFPNPKKQKSHFIGSEALQTKNIKNPIQQGIVRNWDDFEKILHFAFFQSLKVSPDEHPTMLTAPISLKNQREKFTQILFETFDSPAGYLADQSLLFMYGSGRTEGLAVSSGHGITSAVPIVGGYPVEKAIFSLPIGGKDLNEHFMKIMPKQQELPIELFSTMKEKICYIAEDFNKEMSKDVTNSFELPDGSTLEVGKERFLCPEILFCPQDYGIESAGIHENAFLSVMRCKQEVRKELFENIVVGGGTTMLDGFSERLKKEIVQLSSLPSLNVKVISPPERKFSSWVGGSILTSLSSFQSMWISSGDYSENGPIVYKKCLI